MNSSQSVLQSLINHKKPKYSILEDLFNPFMEKTHQVQLYIDLDFVISSYFNPQITQEDFRAIVSGEDSLIGEILNYVAHFRHFFYKTYGCYSRIVLFYSDKIEQVKTLNPDYKDEIYAKRGYDFKGYDDLGKDKLSKEEIKERYDALYPAIAGRLSKILYFVPSAYIINSGTYKPDIIPRVLMNALDEDVENNLNVVISNYSHMIQYVCFKNTVFLENKADNSKIYSSSDFAKMLSTTPKTLEELSSFDISKLPELFALAGSTKYSVANIGKYKTVNSAKAFLKNPDLISTLNQEELAQFNINLKCLSIFEDVEHVSDILLTLLKSQLIDYIDLDGLARYINKNCPSYAVNIIWLTEGENI